MTQKSFETLIKERHITDRWYPTSVERYKYSIKLDPAVPNTPALRSNIAYSLQYLEFLEKEFEELNVSSVIYTMLVKTYVITSMSVLEGIFTNIIKSHGWWKTSNLESLGTTQANETNFDGNPYVVRTELLRKVDTFPLQMNLDELIKVLSRHHEGLQVDHLVYPALRRLKELRNRVHLQKSEFDTDHDYNAFDYSVKHEMGSILHEVLTSSIVSDSPQVFDFLKVNLDEEPEEDESEGL